MHVLKLARLLPLALIAIAACKKDNPRTPPPGYRYFEVAKRTAPEDWRDSAFIVATKDSALLKKIDTQLTLPISQRKIVNGALAEGDGGYNRNASHHFKWRFREDGWALADLSAEIFDGRPYTDVDLHLRYWVDTVKRFAPWNYYIRKEVK